MVTVDRSGKIVPLFLKDVEDENGKVKPRLVNINGENTQLILRNNLHFITKSDYETQKNILTIPRNLTFTRFSNGKKVLIVKEKHFMKRLPFETAFLFM